MSGSHRDTYDRVIYALQDLLRDWERACPKPDEEPNWDLFISQTKNERLVLSSFLQDLADHEHKRLAPAHGAPVTAPPLAQGEVQAVFSHSAAPNAPSNGKRPSGAAPAVSKQRAASGNGSPTFGMVEAGFALCNSALKILIPPPPPETASVSLPDGMVGQAYHDDLALLRWDRLSLSDDNGSGLKLSNGGAITGLLHKKGNFTLKFLGFIEKKSYEVTAQLRVRPNHEAISLGDGRVGDDFANQPLSKDFSNIRLKHDGGSGLIWDERQGEISGLLRKPGRFELEIAADWKGAPYTAITQLDVLRNHRKIQLPKGRVGEDYHHVLCDPKWTHLKLISDGGSGLKLDADGRAIYGVPMQGKSLSLKFEGLWNGADCSIDARIDVAPNIQDILMPNAKMGEAYVDAFSLRELSELQQVEGEHIGLRVAQDGRIEGSPTRYGEFKFRFIGRSRGAPCEIRAELTVNADPDDLWKDLESDPAAPYQKAKTAAEFNARGDLICLAASIRGKSHAHVGGFRDDDFCIHAEGPGDWHVAAVADGAGSAKFSRRG